MRQQFVQPSRSGKVQHHHGRGEFVEPPTPVPGYLGGQRRTNSVGGGERRQQCGQSQCVFFHTLQLPSLLQSDRSEIGDRPRRRGPDVFGKHLAGRRSTRERDPSKLGWVAMVSAVQVTIGNYNYFLVLYFKILKNKKNIIVRWNMIVGTVHVCESIHIHTYTCTHIHTYIFI